MFLTQIDFSEHRGQPNEWVLEGVELKKETLLAGKNATGKTRCLNVINALATLLSGKVGPHSNGDWQCTFTKGKDNYKYRLVIQDQKVKLETLKLRNTKFIDRADGKSRIRFFKNGNSKLDPFFPPEDKLAINVQRDKKVLPFLEELNDWAVNVYSYTFSSARPNHIVIPNASESMLRSLSTVPTLLLSGTNKYGGDYIDGIINDLEKVGYNVEKIKIGQKLVANLPPNILMASVKEKDLQCHTDQVSMSAGMFRAFSILAVINYLLIENKPGTIIIDDLGEGLDFERSSRLAEVIFNKIGNSCLNLIVTTNDRFLMNKVPIENWNILEREGHIVKAYNYKNSKKAFDEFIFTGLNNFSFFSSNFLHTKEEAGE